MPERGSALLRFNRNNDRGVLSLGKVNKVYVVDADYAVRESMVALLGSAGLATRSFSTVGAMLEGFDESEAGCVTADLGGKDTPGLRMLATLRGRGHSVPVVLFSTHWDAEKKRLAEKAGAAALLAKPSDPGEILRLIRALLAG